MLVTTLLALFATLAVAAPTAEPDADASPDTLPGHTHKLVARKSYVGGAGSYVNSNTCPGNQIDGGKFNNGKAQWRLYYSSKDKGTNCLVVDNLTGKAADMTAHLAVQKGKKKDEVDFIGYATDIGKYKSYAGSLRVKGTDGDCVFVTAVMGKAEVVKGPFHCK